MRRLPYEVRQRFFTYLWNKYPDFRGKWRFQEFPNLIGADCFPVSLECPLPTMLQRRTVVEYIEDTYPEFGLAGILNNRDPELDYVRDLSPKELYKWVMRIQKIQLQEAVERAEHEAGWVLER